MSQCHGYHMSVCRQVWVQIVDINMIIIYTLPIPISALSCMSVTFVLRKQKFSEPVRHEHVTDRWDSLNLLLIKFVPVGSPHKEKRIQIIGIQT